MVYLLICMLLPFAAIAACSEGEGSCPSSSGALLQNSMSHPMAVESGGQGGLDHALMMLHEGGDTTGGNGSAALGKSEILMQLEARVKDAVHGGRPLSPLEESLMNSLAEMFKKTTLPALMKGHQDDQEMVNRTVTTLVNCNTNFDADSKSAATAKADVDAHKKKHLDCRSRQSELKSIRKKATTDLKSFVDGLQQVQKPISLDFTNAESYFAAGLRWFKDNQGLYVQKKAVYTAAKDAHEKKVEECNKAQSSYESRYCQWIGQASAASKGYTRCWNQGGGNNWNQTLASVVDSAKERALSYVSVKKIQCYLGSLTMYIKEKRRMIEQNVSACKALAPDTSIFDLVNTQEPPKKDLITLGDLKSMPGDGVWQKSEYANISDTKNVTPCAEAVDENGTKIWEDGNITHFCGVDEHVKIHRCVSCAPGKLHPGGDNAIGADTNCSVIHCGANQHVLKNTCKGCAAGMENSAGDDASGPDTSCTAIICEAGQMVKSNSCHSCPAGTKNEAGGHDASGADTSCDAIKCPANHFVNTSACHTCPPGKTNAAGDDATKGDTTCVATKCAANKKVVSNVCKGCPPGKHNAAGDDASGRDTKCNATICPRNQHVVSNACTACPDGTTRQPGDDASGSDTTCTPIRCAANQHVKSNACKSCPVGQVNDAGDDASGTNTYCEPAFVLATRGANACPSGHASVGRSDCLAAVLSLLPAGTKQGRTYLVTAGTHYDRHGRGWGHVPTGCSVQNGRGGDMSAHFNVAAHGHNDGGYSMVCKKAQTMFSVSGATGSYRGGVLSNVNGGFVRSVALNGRPSYFNSAGAVIRWETGSDWGAKYLGTKGVSKWVIGYNRHHRYYNEATTQTPPEKGWKVRPGFAAGTPVIRYAAACHPGIWTLTLQDSGSRCHLRGSDGSDLCKGGNSATVSVAGYTQCDSFGTKVIPACSSRDSKCASYNCRARAGIDVWMLVDSHGEKVDAPTSDKMLSCNNKRWTVSQQQFHKHAFYKKYANKHPHCSNIRCQTKTWEQFESDCRAAAQCTGFSFVKNAGAGKHGGCLKICGSTEFGGYGHGSHDYWAKV